MAQKKPQRLSAIQKNTLFLLYGFELRGKTDPVYSCQLLDILNQNTISFTTHRNNYNTSCKKLVMSGHLKMYRDRSLKLLFGLSELGRGKAEEIYAEKTAE